MKYGRVNASRLAATRPLLIYAHPSQAWLTGSTQAFIDASQNQLIPTSFGLFDDDPHVADEGCRSKIKIRTNMDQPLDNSSRLCHVLVVFETN
jgi:hypothetical protein